MTVRKLPRLEHWIFDAPCTRGPGSETAHDLPAYLRATRRLRILISDDQRVRAALNDCARCPYTQQCLDRTAPATSHYDGIYGGLVFLNGTVIGGLASKIGKVA